MKKHFHSLLFALSALLLVGGLRGNAYAQCRTEPTEIPWPVPPAVAGQDGTEAGGPGTVFIGERSTGNIQKWTLSLGALQQAGTLMPGNQLPAEVKGIWALAVPKQDLVVALVTYDDAGTERYGILRSENLGQTWALLKPAAFKDDQFLSLEGQSGGAGGTVNFTGSYFRSALTQMTWLTGNGDYGWAWGRKGILRTTDAGLTWSVAYKTANQNDQAYNVFEGVWGLAFESPTQGVAVMGPATDMGYDTTASGGMTWTKTKSLNAARNADLDYVTGEYRALNYSRFTQTQNTQGQYSPNKGGSWLPRGSSITAIPSEAGPMIEWIWPNPQEGFLIYRKGEIRHTTNAGENWSVLQATDASAPTVQYGDGTGGAPYAGYSQKSILVRDDFGDAYIVQAITHDCSGELDSYVPAWPIGTVTSVPVSSKPLLGFTAFPNPTSERCDVRFSLESPEAARAVVVDSRGNIVRNLNFGLLESGEHVESIDLKDLPNGAYRLMVRAGEKRGVESIVVEK